MFCLSFNFSVKNYKNYVLFGLKSGLYSSFPETQKQTSRCYKLSEYIILWRLLCICSPLQLRQVCHRCPVRHTVPEPGFLVSVQKKQLQEMSLRDLSVLLGRPLGRRITLSSLNHFVPFLFSDASTFKSMFRYFFVNYQK